MSRTKKSNFDGSPYQRKKERITILENAIQETINELDKLKTIPGIAKAKQILLSAWIREVNL